MTRRSIDLDQLFVAALDGEPWLPDTSGPAIRAGRRRQRRARALVAAATAAAVAAVLVAVPILGILPRRGPEPVVVAGSPTPDLAPGAPLAIQRPPLPDGYGARAVLRAGEEWVLPGGDILGIAGERAVQVPGQLRAALLYELYDRHGESSVGPVHATVGNYSTAMAEGSPLAWADSTVLRAGSGPLAVRVGLWLSHPASWEGCGVGEADCKVEEFTGDYATVVSLRTATRDPKTGAAVSTWWARARYHNGLLSTVAVQAPLDREEAVRLARAVITMPY